MVFPELFSRCLKVVLHNEGGYSDHPLDPGHATMKGITQAVYDRYRLDEGLEIEPVIHITDEEVYDIYYSIYWRLMNLENIEEEDLILHLFDMGVNAGVRTSIKILQRLLGVTDDGVIGNQTLKAIRDFNGNIIEEYIKRRKLFYVTLAQNKPTLRVFLKGWLNRVDTTSF